MDIASTVIGKTLSAFWSKVNNPYPLLFGGVAVILFAPAEYRWIGFISVALGIAVVVERGVGKLKELRGQRRERGRIRERIGSLNGRERTILYKQLMTGERTFYLNWHDYHGVNRRLAARDEYTDLFNTYTGLAQKGFLNLTTNNTIATIHISDLAWSVLKQDFGANPDSILNTGKI